MTSGAKPSTELQLHSRAHTHTLTHACIRDTGLLTIALPTPTSHARAHILACKAYTCTRIYDGCDSLSRTLHYQGALPLHRALAILRDPMHLVALAPPSPSACQHASSVSPFVLAYDHPQSHCLTASRCKALPPCSKCCVESLGGIDVS